MPRSQKAVNLVGVGVPFLGFLASIFFLWGNFVTWRDLTILVVGYLLTCLGISIGFHRLFTHGAYETYRPVRYSLAVLGSMAGQGPVIRWVSDHRKHHNFADREGHPHSPRAGFGPGLSGMIAGLWHCPFAGSSARSGGRSGRSAAGDLPPQPGRGRLLAGLSGASGPPGLRGASPFLGGAWPLGAAPPSGVGV